MRKIFFTMLVLGCAVMAKAQNEMISAILQTGDEVTMYTGVDAFKNAYNDAADEGSIITLSPGTFNNSSGIEKSVTVYGAGWEEDADKGITPTIINSSLYLQKSNIKLEGLYVNGYISIDNSTSGILIDRCGFNYLRYAADSYDNAADNIMIRRCYFGGIQGTGNYGVWRYITNLRVENCYLYDIFQGGGTQILFDHCIMLKGSKTYAALYTNCILATTGVENNATLKNCICIFSEPGAETGVVSTGCWFGVSSDDIFSEEGGYTYDATRTFELSDPDTYSGLDGKPVGISGGNFPWYKIPSIPIVKSLLLGLDGLNLNVTYEAEAR